MILEHGTLLQGGKYIIEKALGQGSFGITYLATTKVKGPLGDISVKVAIKEFFSKELNKRSEDGTVCDSTSGSLAGRYSKMFLREANNLASLEHPGIVNVLESFSENNTHYYVMEYLEGGSLDDYILSKGHLSETESLEYILQIGSALSYMHSRNMLHLDLKPKNIMLRSDGCLSIIDFGLSKQYESSGEPESSTTIGLGTPGYAPLEQGSEDDRRVFAATLDVYALGATMYKMLTGKTPPRASDVMNDGLPVSDLKKYGVSEDTIASIEKAMDPRKKNRPQTIVEFIDSLPNKSSSRKNVSKTSRSMAGDDESTVMKDSVQKASNVNISADEEETVKRTFGEIPKDKSALLKRQAPKSKYLRIVGLVVAAILIVFLGMRVYTGSMSLTRYDAYLNSQDSNQEFWTVCMNGRWGFVKRVDLLSGLFSVNKEQIPPQYDDAGSFVGDLAPVCIDGRWIYINTMNEQSIPEDFDYALDFDRCPLNVESLAPVCRNGKWGFINREGTTVIPFIYESACCFNPMYNREPQVAAVKKGGKWGFVDKNGKVVLPFRYKGIGVYNYENGQHYFDYWIDKAITAGGDNLDIQVEIYNATNN